MPFACDMEGGFYMKELVMIIRPEKLEDIKQILDDIHCGGMTLSTVMGCGTQKAWTQMQMQLMKSVALRPPLICYRRFG